MGREIYFMKDLRLGEKKYGFRNYIWIGSGNLSETKGPAPEI